MDEQTNGILTTNELQDEKNKTLEQPKNDILGEIQAKTNKKTLQWSSTTITIVLAILAAVSIVQTVESTLVWRKIKDGATGFAPSSPAAGNLQNLPDMVGGC